jgi:putative amino-acid transport system ATP-binding protein
MISISGLNKSFGGTPVLTDISIEIAPGEKVVVIGPSGTGKSTLLRCINFLDKPDSGIIRLGNLTVDAASATRAQILALRRSTAYVFQNYALFANKTARENITEALITVCGQSKAAANLRADAILREIGLEEKSASYPASLSGGQQQRVGIGRAMALDAEVMLLDEPTSSLDPEWVGEVLDLMRRVAKRPQTMLIVTHEMQFAREIADRILFMDAGRIVEQGTPGQILDDPQDPRTKAFLRRVTAGNALVARPPSAVSPPDGQ